MELKNLLTPWNWFKKEEERSPSVRHQNGGLSTDHPLGRLHREIDNLFDQAFQGLPWSGLGKEQGGLWKGMLSPHLDIEENSTHYTVTVEVPGVEEKDINLTLTDGTLTIRGEKRHEQEDTNRHYHRVERTYGSFQRVLSLPTDVNQQTVEAKFKNGILRITMAKDPHAHPAARNIPIT